ncbi:MAG: YabP/YqfC family sporulation protein [Clostridia bacterium]|nr:YabP/YqfC family sporulation protein [Clostridia bacterium]
MIHPFSRRIEEALEIPDGLLTGDVHLDMAGNRRVIVEGCCDVLQYDEDVIRLRTRSGELRFRGSELCMGSLNKEGALISGRLLSVEFLD